MFTPKTPLQNLMFALVGFMLSVLIAFITALSPQLNNDVIVWRLVIKSTLDSIAITLPALVVFLGLPTFGMENISYLTRHVGKDRAIMALENERRLADRRKRENKNKSVSKAQCKKTSKTSVRQSK